MEVMITGGAGYLGTELVYALAADEGVRRITVYDNGNRGNHNLFLGERKLPRDRVRLVRADILDTRTLKKVVAESDVVYHLAAKVTTPFADSHPHLFEQVNHWGTAEVVYAAEETDLSQLIYVSSVSVYGATEDQVGVGSPLNPSTFYGVSKMRGEQHVERYLEDHDGCIIRCGNVYGYSKSMRFDALINRFMFEANFSERVTINGDGEQCRAFIHVDKAVDVLASILATPLPGGTYDLVEHTLSVNEVAAELRAVFPDLETLFVNRHMQLRRLGVRADERVNRRFRRRTSFVDELLSFRSHFSF